MTCNFMFFSTDFVISEQWEGDSIRLCLTEYHLQLRGFPAPVVIEPGPLGQQARARLFKTNDVIS